MLLGGGGSLLELGESTVDALHDVRVAEAGKVVAVERDARLVVIALGCVLADVPELVELEDLSLERGVATHHNHVPRAVTAGCDDLPRGAVLVDTEEGHVGDLALVVLVR